MYTIYCGLYYWRSICCVLNGWPNSRMALILGLFHARSLSSLDVGYSHLLEKELNRQRLIQQVTAQSFLLNRKCADLAGNQLTGKASEITAKINLYLQQQKQDLSRLKALDWQDRNSFDAMEQLVNDLNVTTMRFLVIYSEQGPERAKDFRNVELRPLLDNLNE